MTREIFFLARGTNQRQTPENIFPQRDSELAPERADGKLPGLDQNGCSRYALRPVLNDLELQSGYGR